MQRHHPDPKWHLGTGLPSSANISPAKANAVAMINTLRLRMRAHALAYARRRQLGQSGQQ